MTAISLDVDAQQLRLGETLTGPVGGDERHRLLIGPTPKRRPRFRRLDLLQDLLEGRDFGPLHKIS